MTAAYILKYCIDNLPDTALINGRGESVIFYNSNNSLKCGIYILTVKQKDGDNAKSLKLDRENIFRVNIGVRKSTFISIFDPAPVRPAKGGIVNMPYI